MSMNTFFPAELIELAEQGKIISTAVKPWGHEHIVHFHGAGYIKVITINVGQRTSLQFHERKEEVLFVLEGEGYVETELPVGRYFAGQSVCILPRTIHRAVGPLVLLEFTTPENDDVIRVADDYGRQS